MSKQHIASCSIVGAALAALAADVPIAGAGGIVVPGAGPQAQARAGAFVAKADDPSALGHNPAGFSKMSGTYLMLGANFVDYALTYRRTGSYEPSGEPDPLAYEGESYPVVRNESRPDIGFGSVQAIPTLAVVTDFGQSHWPVRFAFGVFAPQGYPSRHFDESYTINGEEAPGPQRYDIMRQEATIIQPSLAVAYRPIPELDIGVRLAWGFGKIEGQKAVWAIRNYEEFAGRDSIFTVSAKDPFVFGYSAGALYRPTDFLELGVAYNGKLEVHAQGEGNSTVGDVGGGFGEVTTVPVPDEYANCAPGGEEGALSSCINIDIPQMLSAGGRWVYRDALGRERADIELDVRWEDWSSASSTSIIVDGQDSLTSIPLNESVNRHGFDDVYSIRLGGHYALDALGGVVELRGGVAYDTAAAPDSWTRVDIDGKARTTFAGGVAYSGDFYRVELGGGYVHEGDISVEQCAPPDGPSVAAPGCDGMGDQPVLDRDAPDPGQPKQGPLNQVESPFNAGDYESRYWLMSLGVMFWF